MEQLVTTQWLADELGADDLVVLDCTVYLKMTDEGFVAESGRANCEAGHIPGAGFACLTTDLVDTASPHRFAVPAPAEFAAAMEQLGVSDTSRVVLYDDNNAMWAARVWWMLHWIGFDNAALLDGGLKAWKAEDRPLSTDAPSPARGSLTVAHRPQTIADKAEVMAAIDDGATCLIDALPEASFSGEMVMYGRPGHIPGAANASAFSMVDPDTGRFLALDELRTRMPEDSTARVVNYCGGGIAASATAFLQTMMGFKDVAVYTASLQEWVQDPNAPMTTAV